MSKSIEHLLVPRYRIIEDFPGNKDFTVGEIITCNESWGGGWKTTIKDCQGERLYAEGFFELYPHLFRKLEWWEERTEGEIPKFVRCYGKVRIFKKLHEPQLKSLMPYVQLFDLPNEFEYNKGEGYEIYYLEDCTPATKEEYDNQFINKAE